MIYDCHTHRRPPCPDAIVSAVPGEPLLPGQLYSLGIHPWHVPVCPEEMLLELARQGVSPQVVAIGETGLDSLCDTPMWLQVKVFERQAMIAEQLGKPLVVHCVRTAQEVVAVRRVLGAAVPWVIHGFRGKPSVLAMLLGAGCHVSYGERFNPASLAATPPDRLLAETDESLLPVGRIIEALGASCGRDLRAVIAGNTDRLFIHKKIQA